MGAVDRPQHLPEASYDVVRRPVGHAVATINTDSPEHLIEEIRRQE